MTHPAEEAASQAVQHVSKMPAIVAILGNGVAFFLKAADGAAAAGKSASTRFRYNGTNWVQQGGALTYN